MRILEKTQLFIGFLQNLKKIKFKKNNQKGAKRGQKSPKRGPRDSQERLRHQNGLHFGAILAPFGLYYEGSGIGDKKNLKK